MKKYKAVSLALALGANTIMPLAHDSIFKEYDIRGVVGTEFNPEDAYDMGRAIATYYVLNKPDFKTVALGMDGRTHSPAIKQYLTRAFVDSGINVVFVGTCTTPAIYHAMHTMDVDGALMITASHNPAEYNGIKICLEKHGVFGTELRKIRDIYKAKDFGALAQVNQFRSTGTVIGHPIIPTYINYLVKRFSALKGKSLSVIIDCGNGAAGTVIPDLVTAMGWTDVRLLYPEVDGTYPNHVPDPSSEKHMSHLKAALAADSSALFGIGLDGDADRMGAMTKTGNLVPGDRMLALLSKQLVANNPGAPIIFDISSSQGLSQILEAWGATPVISRTGHSHIKAKMAEHNGLLGGEISGHFTFKENFGVDDGIYAMLRLLEIMTLGGKDLDELLKDFPNKVCSPNYRIHSDADTREHVVNALKKHFGAREDAQLITLDGVRVHVPYGMGIVRPSNTEPLLSMRFEGDSAQALEQVKNDFKAIMEEYMDCTFMQD